MMKQTLIKVLANDIPLKVLTKVLPDSGHLVYEYNPFRNFRLDLDMFEYEGAYYTKLELEDNFNIKYIPKDGNVEEHWTKDDELINTNNYPVLREKGELVDFITDLLNLKLTNPVDLLPLYSYDGSVNLILNDGNNIPRLINSRFSSTGNNTYLIIDRNGNNDTNIYDRGDQFNIDTSLYKIVRDIPTLQLKSVDFGGSLPIGNYHFYFKYSDLDGNESDFITESGLVSVFIGSSSPSSIHTGERDNNSFKMVSFILNNVDDAYDYVNVYYSRYTAENNENKVILYVKVDKKYPIYSRDCQITITGFEPIQEITSSDINLQYNVVNAANTLALCLNMLFMGNIHKLDIPYLELQDLSLRIFPYLKEERYDINMDLNYNIKSNSLGYYDPLFIYNKTGYWNEELYRFGIVYILPNNELTPVFNIRGKLNIKQFGTPLEVLINDIDNKVILDLTIDQLFEYFPLYTSELSQNADGGVTSLYINAKRKYIEYNDKTFYILGKNNENIKGVCSFEAVLDSNTIYSIDFRISDLVINELSKYVKGFFFVRLSRIPLKLSQGVVVGIDNISRTPCIATQGGFLTEIAQSLLNTTHVETLDILGVNYISEGFLDRYKFKIAPKPGGFWKTFGKIVAAVVIAAAVAVGAVFTAGALGVAGVVGVAGMLTAGATAVGSVAAVTGIVAGAAVATAAVTVGTVNTVYKVRQKVNRSKISLNGRNTIIPSGYRTEELEESRKISTEFKNRIIIKDLTKVKTLAILCPDYEVNQSYFNSIYTGNVHKILLPISKNNNELSGYDTCYFTNLNNHFYIPGYYDSDVRTEGEFKIVGVSDGVSCIGIGDKIFRSKAGQAEEAFRYEEVGIEFKSSETQHKKINSDIIRGNFGPYLAYNDDNNLFEPGLIVNIYIPGYDSSNMQKYVDMRMNDNTPYSAITDRILISNTYLYKIDSSILSDDTKESGYSIPAYRGDCFICLFTHRLNRNFNDPSAPYNDDIININTWRDNYDPDNTEKYGDINLGDINAVKLGMWVTFMIRSSYNLNIRTIDESYTDEKAMTGNPRGYYPYLPMSTEGVYKTPESSVLNLGFTKYSSERYNFNLPDVPYIKNWFGTRIMYSDIHINDAFKNGYRVYRGTAYRDYTREYGVIVKLIDLDSNLLCVFEHGIALIPVNKGQITNLNNTYINVNNVLAENPIVISDMVGTLWKDSVIKTLLGYVYGVDTVAKKLWRTNGKSIEYISDFRVLEFLNKNISLGERELTPIIGVRNVKTFYNAFKLDVMFTFYDNTYGFEEKVWNLCFNERLLQFTTFYSWMPSYMENINNMPFSFNRETSKWIAKLGVSHTANSFADGITLSNNIIPTTYIPTSVKPSSILPKSSFDIKYVQTPNGLLSIEQYLDNNNQEKQYKPESYKYVKAASFYLYYPIIGKLSLTNRALPSIAGTDIDYFIEYSLEHDNFLNYKIFGIAYEEYTVITNPVKSGDTVIGEETKVRDSYLYLKINCKNLCSELYYRNSAGNSYADPELSHKLNIQDYSGTKFDKTYCEYPIYKDGLGRRVNLNKEDRINDTLLVRLLNVKALINLTKKSTTAVDVDTYFYNLLSKYSPDTVLIDAGYYESVVAVIPLWNQLFLSTDFWKHGQAGIIDIKDTILPSCWYGKLHPFEFEFVVTDNGQYHKIFDNLEIISNNAEPESFHYEIIGDCYEFANDKLNMYYRQEETKHLYLYNGSDIEYDHDYVNLSPLLESIEGTNLYSKSTILPMYYARKNSINEIEDYYYKKDDLNSYDFSALAGGELNYYPTLNEFRFWNHAQAVNILNGGRLRGNMEYKEDKWHILINPLNTYLLNEEKWEGGIPPVDINPLYIPEDIKSEKVLSIPDNIHRVNLNYTLNAMKEVHLKDKWIKIRIRYKGEKLSIILSIKTLYRISYA